MGIKTFKPTSKGVRFRTNSDYADITTSTPEKSLTTVLQSKGGRNNRGRITVRHQGGGNKKLTLKEIKMVFQLLLQQLNTTQIVLLVLH